jgi:hypothetical protein
MFIVRIWCLSDTNWLENTYCVDKWNSAWVRSWYPTTANLWFRQILHNRRCRPEDSRRIRSPDFRSPTSSFLDPPDPGPLRASTARWRHPCVASTTPRRETLATPDSIRRPGNPPLSRKSRGPPWSWRVAGCRRCSTCRCRWRCCPEADRGKLDIFQWAEPEKIIH